MQLVINIELPSKSDYFCSNFLDIFIQFTESNFKCLPSRLLRSPAYSNKHLYRIMCFVFLTSNKHKRAPKKEQTFRKSIFAFERERSEEEEMLLSVIDCRICRLTPLGRRII